MVPACGEARQLAADEIAHAEGAGRGDGVEGAGSAPLDQLHHPRGEVAHIDDLYGIVRRARSQHLSTREARTGQ